MSTEARAGLRVGECPHPTQPGVPCPACGSLDGETPHRVPFEDYLRWLRGAIEEMRLERVRRWRLVFIWAVVGLLLLAVLIAWLRRAA